MKKSFTLLETIIVVLIIAIISSVGLYKLFFNLDSANILKVKTEINLIKNAITKKHNENILKNSGDEFESLDDTSINTKNQILFSNVLDHILISTNSHEKSVAKWIKVSQKSYEIYISKDQSIVFDFDSAHATFDCDFENALCKELYQ